MIATVFPAREKSAGVCAVADVVEEVSALATLLMADGLILLFVELVFFKDSESLQERI